MVEETHTGISDVIPVRLALLSVSDKTGLTAFARALSGAGVALLSSGGTAAALSAEGLAVTDVSTHTGAPEMLDGRVKTLHPRIHGGILAKRDNPEHLHTLEAQSIPPIDLVVVNLYPFEETVARGASFAECVENIDIGGPAMIRAAAKNHSGVVVVVDPADYARVAEAIASQGGVPGALARELAAKAFARTASYDAAIAHWFTESEQDGYPEHLSVAATLKQPLRYGENPHQSAALYVASPAVPGVATATQLQGKELSYNNLNDTNAAFELVSEFAEPAVVLIKHANPCGVAVAATPVVAFRKALVCDSVSAYGGILALNRVLDEALVAEIGSLFLEVIIAPEVTDGARDLLQKKQNLRVMVTGAMPDPARKSSLITSIAGGFLVQDRDAGRVREADLRTVTKRVTDAAQLADLLFAFTVCKHVKSNAIVLAEGGATVGIGAGQMSRIDSTRIAAWKRAERVQGAGFGIQDSGGLVLASDAFFPFPDNVVSARDAGVTAIIQPGGSIRDAEVIAAADAADMAMVFCGMRHFRH
jgi:phosphoribosylaminoimidazolecarboxamide formyltransferase/IMP cyclohydrolase